MKILSAKILEAHFVETECDAVGDTIAEGKKQGQTRIFYAIKSKGAEC